MTKTGIKQAQDAAELIKKLNIDYIYTSPIQRALDTAKIVSKDLPIEPIIDDRLIELEMGEFTGSKYDDVFVNDENVFLKFYEGNQEIASRGIETFKQVKERIQSIIRHVSSEHKDKNIVLVTHMDPIKAALSSAITLQPKDLCGLIIANASINIFKEYDGDLVLNTINYMEPSRFSDPIW